jgi:ABC-type transport system involved in multi-copper enzyme maturation permease subunit
MRAAGLIALEELRHAFASRLVILLAAVGVLFLLVTSCFAGANLNANGRILGGEEQLGLARAVVFHFAVAWGVLFATMLGMSAASRPLDDGRTALLCARGLRRGDVLLGQLLGAWLTALASVAALAALGTVVFLLRGYAFPATLWLGVAVASVALALATALAAFVSTFLPRVVAGMAGILAYAFSFPAAFPQLRTFLTAGYDVTGVQLPWYFKWGSELYFTAWPPLAGAQLRAGDLLALPLKWGSEGWLTLGTAVGYVALLYLMTFAVFRARDI